MGIENCKLITLPKVTDARGNLTFVESNKHIPFITERVYYLYDVPADATRAGHAHKQLEQLYIAVSGSFDVSLNDGNQVKTFTLNRPYQGLYISQMIWRELHNFSSGSVCLVLASQHFNESDYFRDYSHFLSAIKAKL